MGFRKFSVFTALITLFLNNYTRANEFRVPQKSLNVTHHRHQKGAAPILDLETTAEEYRAYLRKHPLKPLNHSRLAANPLDDAIAWGENLSRWIDLQNQSRPADRQLRLSNPLERRGIPIDAPSVFSDVTVAATLSTLRTEIPAELQIVLNGNTSATVSLSDDEIILQGKKVKKLYETSVRIRLLDPYRDWFTNRATEDVRGLHYLNSIRFEQNQFPIPTDANALQKLRTALIGICLNNQVSRTDCTNALPTNLDSTVAAAYFNKYIAQARLIWSGFYKVENARTDVRWDGHEAHINFIRPADSRIEAYLVDNIQAEWKWNGWQLFLDMGSFSRAPHIRFQAGTTPHVNSLGGDEIVMDANEPIEEYSSKWTIRHEFGHVLGFPDCYFEFYDTSLNAYVNYQLDVTDLMCSRAGDMNQRLYDEMLRVYGANAKGTKASKGSL